MSNLLASVTQKTYQNENLDLDGLERPNLLRRVIRILFSVDK
jgi:hypothetical protein